MTNERSSYLKDPPLPWEMRLTILAVTIFITLGLLGLRLFQKQVLEHGEYEAKAENQYYTKKEITAPRGKIYAHRSKDDPSDLYPLAINTTKYDLTAVPRKISDKAQIAEKIAPILKEDQAQIFGKIDNDKLYVLLAKKIDEAEADQIKKLNLENIYLSSTPSRFYPEGELDAHILGFVNFEDQGNYGVEGEGGR